MIGQVLKRGSSVRGLLYYLFTEGLAGEKGLDTEHRDARVITGWDPADTLQTLQPPLTAGGSRDFARLTGQLNAPLAALGMTREQLRAYRPVYHLALAAAPADRVLDDGQWADIARTYMHHLGLAPHGQDTGVRWVAVRHADNHVHIVATLARQDGRRPNLFNDRYRSRDASLEVETAYDLTPTAAGGRTAVPQTSRAEQRKHQHGVRAATAHGRLAPAGPDRDVLRRHVRAAAAGATGQDDFLARLRADGLMVRLRMSERDPGQVTGYAVALPGRDTRQPIWFGGGRLAADLTLPRLRHRWPGPDPSGPASPAPHPGRRGPHLDPAERARVWAQVTHATRHAEQAITADVRAGNHDAAADAAWATSDLLAGAARVIDGRRPGPLSQAARAYEDAARELSGRIPTATAAGAGLRQAGRLMATLVAAQPSETRQLIALLAQLAALGDTVTRLRESQQRAGQAAAARRATAHLLPCPTSPAGAPPEPGDTTVQVARDRPGALAVTARRTVGPEPATQTGR